MLCQNSKSVLRLKQVGDPCSTPCNTGEFELTILCDPANQEQDFQQFVSSRVNNGLEFHMHPCKSPSLSVVVEMEHLEMLDLLIYEVELGYMNSLNTNAERWE